METPVTPGWKTTEFWLAVGSSLAIVLTAMADVLPKEYAGIALAAVNGIYAISRAYVKAHQMQGQTTQVDVTQTTKSGEQSGLVDVRVEGTKK